MIKEVLRDRRKRVFIIIGGVVTVLLFLVVLLISNQPPRTHDPESHDAGIVIVDDKGLLQDVLFELQYYAVIAAVSDYIRSDMDASVDTAEIVGEPSFPQNGIINAKFKTDNPEKEFTIQIDRTVDFDTLLFSVPERNYKKTLQVYQGETTKDVGE